MLSFDHDTTTSVTVEHLIEDQLVVATMDWPSAQPIETYTLDATANVSLELDKHFPVRLARIVLADHMDEYSLVTLEHLAGAELATAMQSAPRIGFCSLLLTLTDPQRLAIANLQVGSPSSPALMRRACEAIMRGAMHHTVD